MNSTFYNGISGVKTHQFGIDSWSNNIANISTNGYKAQLPEFSTIFATTMQGLDANSPISNDKGYGATRSANAIDMTVGSLSLADESPLNMALSGDGWFVIGNQSGSKISYTRDGAFQLSGNRVENGAVVANSAGYIVTNSGSYLYGVDLGRTTGSQFSTEPFDAAALTNVTNVNGLTPLQIPENLVYPPKASTQVYAAINLNPTTSLKDISSAFKGYVPDLNTDMADFAGFAPEDTITINGSTLTYGTDFTSIAEFLSQTQTLTGLNASYNSNGEIVFTNTTEAPIDVTFASTNDAVLTNLGLQATSTIESTQTLALTPTIPTSTKPIFNENAFRSTDLSALYNEDGTPLLIEEGDEIDMTVEMTVEETIVVTEITMIYGTDFRTVGELMALIESNSGFTSSIDTTNNALKFTNETTSSKTLKFDSTNESIIQALGLPANASIAVNSFISSSSLKAASYRALNDIYDAGGTKLLLDSTFTLQSREPDIWSVQSGIYDRQGETLLSSEVVNSTLSFDANGNLTQSSGVPIALTLSDGTIINFDPTKDKTAFDLEALGQEVPIQHQTSSISYMSSSIKQKDHNGNAEGYFRGLEIDTDGIISFSFSNDKFETFGRVGVAGFINNQGLGQTDNTLFKETANSGQASLLWDWGQKNGSLRSTSVLSGKLEMSNVDIATALTELMVFQRAYSASTKSITTADELVKEAIALKK
jgi:flagellar hook protein FlgE